MMLIRNHDRNEFIKVFGRHIIFDQSSTWVYIHALLKEIAQTSKNMIYTLYQ